MILRAAWLLLVPTLGLAQDAPVPVDDAPPTDDAPVPVDDAPGPVDDAPPVAPLTGESSDPGPMGDDPIRTVDDDAAALLDEPYDDVRADAPPLAGGNVITGQRIAPYGAGSGVDFGYAHVLGSNGGTLRGMVRARYASGRFGVQLGLPFANYRVSRLPRESGVGNLQLSGWYDVRDDAEGYLAVGLETHGNLGERTYTWANDGRELWPGYGVSAVVQARRTVGALTTLGRGAIGARSARDHGPFEPQHVHFELAFAADYQLGERFGVLGETSFSWWDISPWDAAILGRADLIEGLRLRGGFVLPLGTWVGFSRMEERFHGVREVSLTADLSMAF